MAIVQSQSKALQGLPRGKTAIIVSGRLKYVDRADYVPEPAVAEPVKEKPKRPRTPAAKRIRSTWRFSALRDRWLERVNEEPALLMSQAKYDVGRLPPPQPSPGR